jgi:hypothetical protein
VVIALLLVAVTVSCGRPLGVLWYEAGVIDAEEEPEVCATVEAMITADPDLEAVHDAIVLSAMTRLAQDKPEDPMPSTQHLGRYADGVMDACGVTDSEG